MTDVIKNKKEHLRDYTLVLLTVGVFIWLLARGSSRLGYNWQWYRIPDLFLQIDGGHIIWGPLVKGLLVTMQITLISIVVALFFAVTTALLRLSSSIVGRLLARAYLELIRNTPLLVQIFFLYFVLAPVLDLSRFWAAVLALSLFEGAYASEIFRAGILSIDKGQWEAARSIGLKHPVIYRKIILPQALRRIAPPLTNQAISLIKDSALVSTIAVYDLTMQGRAIIAETFLTFEVWFTVAAVYLVITLTLSSLVHFLEKRFPVMTC